MIKGWFNPALTQVPSASLNKKMPPDTLFEKFKVSGERCYLTCLVEYFNQSLFHYLLSQTDKATAEDVLQNTWLKVMKSANNTKQNTEVKRWLFTVARNTLIDELRTKNRRQAEAFDEQEHNGTITNKPEKIYQQQNKLALFNQAFDELPRLQKEAFIFQQEGLSIIEIAQLINEPVETVKSRLRYAKKQLKTQLELHS